MPYIPNARMDRTKSEKEVFTLKYFTQFINSLNFIEVWVFDPHSYVSEALINNIRFLSVENIIKHIIAFEYNNDIDLVYFPDAGAMKRYSQYFTNQNKDMIYGNKVRNWETGKIEGLEILNKDGKPCEKSVVDGKKILMIDDIISYGGTMAYSADKLHEMGAKQIDIYVSHLENSFFDKEKGTLRKRMEFGTNIVNCIYTTNSIYKEENNTENFNIKIINNFKIK
jgi:ribose-phosphate pyrophosphokinase